MDPPTTTVAPGLTNSPWQEDITLPDNTYYWQVYLEPLKLKLTQVAATNGLVTLSSVNSFEVCGLREPSAATAPFYPPHGGMLTDHFCSEF